VTLFLPKCWRKISEINHLHTHWQRSISEELLLILIYVLTSVNTYWKKIFFFPSPLLRIYITSEHLLPERYTWRNRESYKCLYCINDCLIWSWSISINSCKSLSVSCHRQDASLSTNGQNSCVVGQAPVP